ncbi:MAG: MBOAT family protein [Eubacterium sp.]|nr:MBOAT family protein [Eubacterium sp.]
MLFSSITFLYGFLPVVIAGYYLLPKKFRNIWLLIASLFFYGWGEHKFLLVIILTILVGYISGIMTEKYSGRKSTIWFLSGVFIELGSLVFFKYSNFFIENYNALTGSVYKMIKVALPLGISFYTFQILSYNIDVYRGRVKAQHNLIDLSCYVCLFPQLIAGPIVRYQTVEKELKSRKETVDKFSYGIIRFVTGLGKKVLLANTAGSIYNEINALSDEKSSIVLMWIATIAFSFQIYFDFSGYSDMAIGLGRMFGFKFLENFDHPYMSKSITEFWRRWHISLSSWFKDYLYIPLGGNRRGKKRQALNLLVVWLLTGFWHGAAWNFVIWGGYYFVLLMIEKLGFEKVLKKLPGFISRIYTLFFINLGWVIFANDEFKVLKERMAKLFLGKGLSFAGNTTGFYIGEFFIFLIVAAVLSTDLIKKIKIKNENLKTALYVILILAVMTLSTAFLAQGAYNPFIYFRF